MAQPESGDSLKRILIADDDDDVCALLAVVLKPYASIVTVHDAESALQMLAERGPFDAIISDYMLPGITGLEFVKRIRQEPLTKATPVLMISGHDRCAIDVRAREAGADAFLNKPFTLAQLRATISRLLGPSVSFV